VKDFKGLVLAAGAPAILMCIIGLDVNPAT
jgi:hypothetical protein